jgi:predicted Zn-dependent protease
MANDTPTERYLVSIDASARTKDDLFTRFTEAAYLGYSSFSSWDAFNEMLLDRLEVSDILIEISNEDLTGLSERDREIYLQVLADAAREFPKKLRLL